MIPIRKDIKFFEYYRDEIIKYIKSKKGGAKKLSSINKSLSLVVRNLTLDRLILMDCDSLQLIKKRYKKYKRKLSKVDRDDSFKTLTILQTYYDDFFRMHGVKYIDQLGVNVCPYCNRTFIYNTAERRTAEFDHFIPQTEYPIFAICLFNLVPSCQICNGLKNADTSFFYNPYNKNLKFDTYLFKPKWNNGKYELILTANTEDKKTLQGLETLTKKLGLKDLYLRHSDLVKEMDEKRQIYNDEYIKELFDRYIKKFGYSKNKQKDFIRIILGQYAEEQDYYKRVLSKATKDIAEYFNLFDLFK